MQPMVAHQGFDFISERTQHSDGLLWPELMGGVVTRADLAIDLVSYFNTFAGSAVAGAVGLALLDVLRDERLLDNARLVGDYIIAGLRRLQLKHSLIGEFRGKGMFFGVEMVRDCLTKEPAIEETRQIVNGMYEHGVLISSVGPRHNVLKIRPPMPFSNERISPPTAPHPTDTV
jgi:4-aminobutyrate aminotransferase-like enzyme